MSARTALVVGIAFVAACDLALGITNVPSQDGGASDGAVDVAFDSIAVPDGDVPDGECNGGAEDCSNGKDDNCNGLVDCDDPVCQGAGYACTSAVPSGWSGPIAFAAAAGGTLPISCSGNYGVAGPEGHDGFDAPPATCGCTCPSQSSNASCGDPTASVYGGSTGCAGNPAQVVTLPLNTCVTFNTLAGSVWIDAGAFSPGSCAPSPTKTVAPITWSNSYVACGYSGPSDDGGCGAGLCVQKPSSAFAAATCIFQPGDVTCPGAPYTKKTVVFTSSVDTRSCTSCTCTASGGGCTQSGNGFSDDTTCTTTGAAFQASSTCNGAGASWESAKLGASSVTPATCNAGGGVTTGDAGATAPVTVCCQ